MRSFVMRSFVFAALAACSSSPPTHEITLDTTFTITTAQGTGMTTSPLAPLVQQPIDIEVSLDNANVYQDPSSDAPGCKSTYFEVPVAVRTSFGVSAATVKAQLLDMLPDWQVRAQLCTDPAQSSISIVATIDALNLAIGCGGFPTSAQITGSDGNPALESVAATSCTATILDVVNNLDLGASGFGVTIVTGPAHVP